MSDANLDVKVWLERLSRAKTKSEIYAILDEFRPLNWTDEQRSAVSRFYMRMLEGIGFSSDEDAGSAAGAAAGAGAGAAAGAAKPGAPANDGPVWYEKM